MPTFVTTPGNELTWQQTAQGVTNSLIQQGYGTEAAAWQAFYPGFHAAHPQYSVQQVLSAFLATELAGGLKNAIPKIANTVGVQIPKAIGAAATVPNLSNPLAPLADIGDFFHRLTEASTWLRVGEVVAGLLLVYIGLKASVTPGGIPVASQGVKNTALRIAKKTPAGFVATRGAYRRGAEKHIVRQETKLGITRKPAPKSVPRKPVRKVTA